MVDSGNVTSYDVNSVSWKEKESPERDDTTLTSPVSVESVITAETKDDILEDPPGEESITKESNMSAPSECSNSVPALTSIIEKVVDTSSENELNAVGMVKSPSEIPPTDLETKLTSSDNTKSCKDDAMPPFEEMPGSIEDFASNEDVEGILSSLENEVDASERLEASSFDQDCISEDMEIRLSSKELGSDTNSLGKGGDKIEAVAPSAEEMEDISAALVEDLIPDPDDLDKNEVKPTTLNSEEMEDISTSLQEDIVPDCPEDQSNTSDQNEVKDNVSNSEEMEDISAVLQEDLTPDCSEDLINTSDQNEASNSEEMEDISATLQEDLTPDCSEDQTSDQNLKCTESNSEEMAALKEDLIPNCPQDESNTSDQIQSSEVQETTSKSDETEDISSDLLGCPEDQPNASDPELKETKPEEMEDLNEDHSKTTDQSSEIKGTVSNSEEMEDISDSLIENLVPDRLEEQPNTSNQSEETEEMEVEPTSLKEGFLGDLGTDEANSSEGGTQIQKEKEKESPMEEDAHTLGEVVPSEDSSIVQKHITPFEVKKEASDEVEDQDSTEENCVFPKLGKDITLVPLGKGTGVLSNAEQDTSSKEKVPVSSESCIQESERMEVDEDVGGILRASLLKSSVPSEKSEEGDDATKAGSDVTNRTEDKEKEEVSKDPVIKEEASVTEKSSSSDDNKNPYLGPVGPLTGPTRIKTEKKFKCTKCCKAFTRLYNLRKHIKINHDTSSPKKSDMDKPDEKDEAKSKDEEAKADDMNIEEMFTCKMCGKVFCKKYNYVAHMKIHRGVKDFICKVCGKSFYRKIELNQHMKNIHKAKDKDFVCSVCNTNFTDPKIFNELISKRDTVNDYVCGICLWIIA